MAEPSPIRRRLAAILAADVSGYSRLIGADEEGTLARLRAMRVELIDPAIADHRGRLVKSTGDGLLVEFSSTIDALRCALSWQSAVPRDGAIHWRIGIHQGDVVVEDGDIFGDGVNIAARLEGLADLDGICVSARVREDADGKLDLRFEDLGEPTLKNIERGVRVYKVVLQPAMPARPLPLPDKPSLVVLPFQNMSGDPEQDYFADGMVEEITTAIARLPWLFVIARNSAFTYKGKAVDVKKVAQDLGVRYVLEGSVRKAGNRVRITGQLIDTDTGAHIWADRFDGSLDDVFELQDRVAASVIGAIEPKLRQSEIERSARKPTESLDAYDLYLRALALAYQEGEEARKKAITLLREALSLDPGYAPAAALIASIRSNQDSHGVRLSPEEMADALRLARRAIDTGGNNPEALANAGAALALLAGEHATAMRAIERALALNPNFARGWHAAAIVHCFADRPEAAIEAVRHAMRLSPLDPLSFGFSWIMGYALMLAGRYEEAIEWVDRCLHDRPGFHPAIRARVALCGYLGRREEAREWIGKLLAVNPAHTVAWYKQFGGKFLSPATLAIWVEGLRRAGLPEE